MISVCICANADGPRDAALCKIGHIAVCNHFQATSVRLLGVHGEVLLFLLSLWQDLYSLHVYKI